MPKYFQQLQLHQALGSSSTFIPNVTVVSSVPQLLPEYWSFIGAALNKVTASGIARSMSSEIPLIAFERPVS